MKFATFNFNLSLFFLVCFKSGTMSLKTMDFFKSLVYPNNFNIIMQLNFQLSRQKGFNSINSFLNVPKDIFYCALKKRKDVGYKL